MFLSLALQVQQDVGVVIRTKNRNAHLHVREDILPPLEYGRPLVNTCGRSELRSLSVEAGLPSYCSLAARARQHMSHNTRSWEWLVPETSREILVNIITHHLPASSSTTGLVSGPTVCEVFAASLLLTLAPKAPKAIPYASPVLFVSQNGTSVMSKWKSSTFSSGWPIRNISKEVRGRANCMSEGAIGAGIRRDVSVTYHKCVFSVCRLTCTSGVMTTRD